MFYVNAISHAETYGDGHRQTKSERGQLTATVTHTNHTTHPNIKYKTGDWDHLGLTAGKYVR